MNDLSIDCHYAGGNIRVLAKDEGSVKLEQDIRDTTTWWFYWNFSVKSSAAQEVHFEFMNGEVIGPWGPAVSKDGVEWNWLGEASLISRQAFKYRFTNSDEHVYFSFCLPYQLHHFERFYSGIRTDPRVHRRVLTLSEQLRPVPLLLAGNENGDRHTLFTCRHHACESTPSYILEGLLHYFLEQEHSRLLDSYLVHYVPFVDLDGVENGDQGKCRAPHDHNQDYTEHPQYAAVAAIVDYVRTIQPEVGIDFHGPYKWGDGVSRHIRNNYPFIVKPASPHKEEAERFGLELMSMTNRKQEGREAIRYNRVHDIEKGDSWNQGNRATSSRFFISQQMKLAFTFEFPYFGTRGQMVTPHTCREFGRDFAKALERYLLEEA